MSGKTTDLDDIRRQYESGEMNGLKEDLKRFIRSHALQIRKLQQEQSALAGGHMPDDVAVKLYILRHRTVNPQRDIQDQLAEIRKKEDETRFLQGGLAADPQQIAMEWAREHSAQWRAYRVTSVVYVFERGKEEYLKILQKGSEGGK